MELVIGDRAFSTWSLRPWLVLKRCGAEFTTTEIKLDQPETAEQIARHSPTGKVPVLKVEGETIWDSLSISVWCAERYPEARLWPADAHARWMARSVTCEMHSAFMALRSECGMGREHHMVGKPGPAHTPSQALSADIRRLVSMWSEARRRFGGGEDYLFGQWSIPDAFFTPVACRIRHYQLDLAAHGDDGTAQAYVRTLLNDPHFLEWEREVL
ncbi:glutathione S-transferase family protein [Brevundimonas sp.]|uniref:glutathione S-transferase family protein n=1 Tax=Brevundimonas sp. TaxID=1871086 RepID=UPI0025CBA49B|nr:glutathione S-transferase family protein [Brevundimonas sp.]